MTLPARQVPDHLSQLNFDAIARYLHWGQGSPEGRVNAPTGAIYLNTDGGSITTLYIKESGNANTGWIAK